MAVCGESHLGEEGANPFLPPLKPNLHSDSDSDDNEVRRSVHKAFNKNRTTILRPGISIATAPRWRALPTKPASFVRRFSPSKFGMTRGSAVKSLHSMFSQCDDDERLQAANNFNRNRPSFLRTGKHVVADSVMLRDSHRFEHKKLPQWINMRRHEAHHVPVISPNCKQRVLWDLFTSMYVLQS